MIVGVIALRHLPTLLNVDVDVDERQTARGKTLREDEQISLP